MSLENAKKQFGPDSNIATILFLEDMLFQHTQDGLEKDGTIKFPKWVADCLQVIDEWRFD